MVANLLAKAEDVRDACSVPGLGRSPLEGDSNPFQRSCPENPMDRGAWQGPLPTLGLQTMGLGRVGCDSDTEHTQELRLRKLKRQNSKHGKCKLKRGPLLKRWCAFCRCCLYYTQRKYIGHKSLHFFPFSDFSLMTSGIALNKRYSTIVFI